MCRYCGHRLPIMACAKWLLLEFTRWDTTIPWDKQKHNKSWRNDWALMCLPFCRCPLFARSQRGSVGDSGKYVHNGQFHLISAVFTWGVFNPKRATAMRIHMISSCTRVSLQNVSQLHHKPSETTIARQTTTWFRSSLEELQNASICNLRFMFHISTPQNMQLQNVQGNWSGNNLAEFWQTTKCKQYKKGRTGPKYTRKDSEVMVSDGPNPYHSVMEIQAGMQILYVNGQPKMTSPTCTSLLSHGNAKPHTAGWMMISHQRETRTFCYSYLC